MPFEPTLDAQSKLQNQREFTRVDDKLPLSWRVVGEQERQSVLQYFQKHRALPTSADAVDNLLSTLDITDKLKQLERQDPNLARILRQLDIKLNLLLHLFHPNEQERPLIPTPVNISGGGLAFLERSPPITVGDYLELRLGLSTEALATIDCFARVVNVAPPNAEGLTKVACNFEPILDVDREKLIQHIFRVQSEKIRIQRLSAPSGKG